MTERVSFALQLNFLELRVTYDALVSVYLLENNLLSLNLTTNENKNVEHKVDVVVV